MIEETYRPLAISALVATVLLLPAPLAFFFPAMTVWSCAACLAAGVALVRTRRGIRIGRRLARGVALFSTLIFVSACVWHVTLHRRENPEGCRRVSLALLANGSETIPESVRRCEGERILVKGGIYDWPQGNEPLQICLDRCFPLEVRPQDDVDVRGLGFDLAVTAVLAIERDRDGKERVVLKGARICRATSMLDPISYVGGC